MFVASVAERKMFRANSQRKRGSMGHILQIRVPELPVQWSRSQGRHRYKREALNEWQERLREIAEEEIALQCSDTGFPVEGPVHVDIGVLLGENPETRVTLSASSYVPPEFEGMGMFLRRDGDNIEKGIFDAFTKFLWKDDNLNYIPSHSFALL
jgi:Holliday junction resolvase RusA-like endonuclease